MDYDRDKVDDAVLALLYLTMWNDRTATRAWKGHDWDAMDRLHQKGYIEDPKSKAKSVAITEEGKFRAEQLFHRLFAPTR
jgi:heme-degrading monooxygenase HmoA